MNSCENDKKVATGSNQTSEEKQESNDYNIAEDSQNAKNKETSNKISITQQQKPLKKSVVMKGDVKVRCMEKGACNSRRSNKDINGILRLEKQGTTLDPLESRERENSHTQKMLKQGNHKNQNKEGNGQMIKDMKQYEESNDEGGESIYR